MRKIRTSFCIVDIKKRSFLTSCVFSFGKQTGKVAGPWPHKLTCSCRLLCKSAERKGGKWWSHGHTNWHIFLPIALEKENKWWCLGHTKLNVRSVCLGKGIEKEVGRWSHKSIKIRADCFGKGREQRRGKGHTNWHIRTDCFEKGRGKMITQIDIFVPIALKKEGGKWSHKLT